MIQRVGGACSRVRRGVRVELQFETYAEQKVPFEVISLAEALSAGTYDGAYLVLGGNGWTLRDFYTEGGLKKHLANADKVQIVTLEEFVARANQGKL